MEKLKGKPNILVILTDQERATMHFPPGWEEENLKNMTKLKQNGFTFDRNYCNTCMCSPSRSTFFSSSYPSQHGVNRTLTYGGDMSPSETTLDPTIPNLATWLSGEGYNVQYRGKWHMSKGATTEDPSPAEIATYGFMGWVAPDAGEDTKPENFGGGFANHDEMYIAQAVKFLREQKANPSKQPFCLIVSLVNPHDVLAYPNQTNYGYQEPDYSGRQIALPATVDEDLTRNYKPNAHHQIKVVMQGGLGALRNEEMELDYINFYAYLLQKIDQAMTPLIDELYDDSAGAPLADQTYVIRTADHGEMGMAHGGLRQKAFNMYEESIRVPLVISNPKVFSGQSTQALSSLLDVLPTLSSLCNLSPDSVPETFKGKDLSPLLFGDKEEVQASLLFTFDDTRAGSNSKTRVVYCADRLRAIIEKNWKYARYFDALGSYKEEYEMYDLSNDPLETNNLANERNPDYSKPKYAKERARLEKELEEAERKLYNRQSPAT